MPREKPPTPVVLVVDDEALIRWALSEGLAESGYTVRVASTGDEARRAVAGADSRPLIVLLDLRLPDVSDFSLLQDIRLARPDAMVLMMTAHGSDEDAAAARALGARDFIAKPFDVSDVVRRIGSAWAASHPSRLH